MTERFLDGVEHPLTALCCLPSEGQAVVGDGEPFTPPWAL